jgi:four helix bundle protein
VKSSCWGKEDFTVKQIQHQPLATLLPHHRLRAYATALELLRAVRGAQIRDRTLRDQALRAAKNVCLNLAEGAGRVTRADKARAYTVARGELVEAVAAVEIAAETGDVQFHVVPQVQGLANELYAVLTKLVR